jgi:HEPN domain-containing protein
MALKISTNDLVCFLAQQSVEKYLKALLCETSIPFPKTHDLNELAALLPEHLGYPENFSEPISRLDRYAVEFRYPGASATKELQRRPSKTPGLFEIGVEKRQDSNAGAQHGLLSLIVVEGTASRRLLAVGEPLIVKNSSRCGPIQFHFVAHLLNQRCLLFQLCC